MDDFKLDKRLERLLREGEVQTPPFAYFQAIAAKKRQREQLESLLFALASCLLFVLFYYAVGLGYGKAVQAFFGLVWLGLPLLLVPGREMWKYAAD